MPARQDLATVVAFEAVADEYRPVVQQAGLRVGVINVCAADCATPDELRRSLVRQVQRTLPSSVPLSVRADASCFPDSQFHQHEQQVKAAVIATAHQSPVLRQVVEVDRSGRETTSFYGKKRGEGGWMEQYTDKPRLMTKIEGVPVGTLPVIL